MKEILFTINIYKKPFIIAMCILLSIIIIAGSAAGIFLYRPWYNGKWNGEFEPESALSLVKNGDDLKILQVTDLHVDHTNEQHEQIWENLEALVMSQDIDLTVITGDWVSSKDNLEKTKRLVSVMDGCGKPWAVVFGNHDSEGEASKEELSALFENAEHCLYSAGPDDLSGMGNYIINVYNHDNPSHLDASLVLMDTHGGTGKTLQYEPIYRDQIKWYDRSIKGINEIYTAQSGNKASAVPSLLFEHIALNEYKNGWELGKLDTSKHLHGSNNEDVYPGVVNTGTFKKILENGSTKGVFCGHDHANTSAVEYKGIILAYGVQTGTCESDPFAQTLQKGGNLITLKDDGALSVEQVFHEKQYEIKR